MYFEEWHVARAFLEGDFKPLEGSVSIARTGIHESHEEAFNMALLRQAFPDFHPLPRFGLPAAS